MTKIKTLVLSVLSTAMLNTTAQASMLDQVIYNVVGQASNATGARLGDEIYYGSSKGARSSKRKTKRKTKRKAKRKAKRRYKKKHVSRAPAVPKMTDEKRIQKALTSLGFYKGKIDGQVNSFETRSAIKEMNIAYGMSNNASLNPQAKDTLIFLGTLFGFDRTLIASSTDNKTKSKKIQTALKIHGYYHDKIDGAIGSGTRACISNYKRDKTGSSSSSLDFEEEYLLISTAKVKNDKNIEDSIGSLKSHTIAQTTPQYGNNVSPQQIQGRTQPVNNISYNHAQQQNTAQVQKPLSVTQSTQSTQVSQSVQKISQPQTQVIQQVQTKQ